MTDLYEPQSTQAMRIFNFIFILRMYILKTQLQARKKSKRLIWLTLPVPQKMSVARFETTAVIVSEGAYPICSN